MDKKERDRFSMLTILHATCQTALQTFGRSDADGQLVAALKRVLEQTRRELDALART